MSTRTVDNPVDTDMNRGFNIPKVARVAAQGIFGGLQNGEGYLSRSPVAVHRGGLAHWHSQGARTAVLGFRAAEGGEFVMTLRMQQRK